MLISPAPTETSSWPRLSSRVNAAVATADHENLASDHYKLQLLERYDSNSSHDDLIANDDCNLHSVDKLGLERYDSNSSHDDSIANDDCNLHSVDKLGELINCGGQFAQHDGSFDEDDDYTLVIQPSPASHRSVAYSNRSAQSEGEQTLCSSAKVVQWQLPEAKGAIDMLRNTSFESGVWSASRSRRWSWGSRGSPSSRRSLGTPPLDRSLGAPNRAPGRLGRLASGQFLFGLTHSTNTSPASPRSPARATPWSCVTSVAGFMTRLLPGLHTSPMTLTNARAQPHHQSRLRRPKKQQQPKMNFHELRNAWEASNEDDYYLMAAEKPRGGKARMERTLEEVFSDDDNEPGRTAAAAESRRRANAQRETPCFSW